MSANTPENEKNWYAIFTKPRSEKKVYQRMKDNEIEVFRIGRENVLSLPDDE